MPCAPVNSNVGEERRSSKASMGPGHVPSEFLACVVKRESDVDPSRDRMKGFLQPKKPTSGKLT